MAKYSGVRFHDTGYEDIDRFDSTCHGHLTKSEYWLVAFKL